jgi:hypothetical protein
MYPPRRIGANFRGRLWLFHGAAATADRAPVGRLRGRPGALNFSCLSHVCVRRAVTYAMAGGGSTTHAGSSTMPRPASRNFAFQPEQIRVMHRAFEAVCAKLQLSTGRGDRVTELVALRIIELALAGERNADRLTARVLAEFGIRE